MTALNFSVLTNPGALIALQSLTRTNIELGVTQDRVSTGLEVASAEDGPAIFAIAQNIRADLGGLRAVDQSLDRARSALDVAIQAGETISNLLIMAQQVATAATDVSLDAESRDALNDDFTAILAQIDAVVAQADFNGTNIVSAMPDNISAIVDGNAVNTIDVAGADLTVTGLGILQTGFVSAAEAQTALDQVMLAFTGLNDVLASFGAGAEQIDLQIEFSQLLSDTLNVGVGNLVDADLAREAANLEATQVQQQLGLAALGIANSAPSVLLSLFS
ncbi:MAG: flagellin [Rhodothalassiaceae bacterium]